MKHLKLYEEFDGHPSEKDEILDELTYGLDVEVFHDEYEEYLDDNDLDRQKFDYDDYLLSLMDGVWEAIEEWGLDKKEALSILYEKYSSVELMVARLIEKGIVKYMENRDVWDDIQYNYVTKLSDDFNFTRVYIYPNQKEMEESDYGDCDGGTYIYTQSDLKRFIYNEKEKNIKWSPDDED